MSVREERMRAIVVKDPGDAGTMRVAEIPRPAPRPGEVLIKVVAAGVNRADIVQRKGHYPPPAGITDILGMEVSGQVASVGTNVARWRVGDAVCALLAGGGTTAALEDHRPGERAGAHVRGRASALHINHAQQG